MSKTSSRIFYALWAVTAVLMVVALWLVFLRAPEERVMGAAQKIFFFHVPAAVAAFASVFLLLGSSIAYLWTRNLVWDNLSRAATETALLFCTLVLITGPIWAKPAWAVWWTWEPKLTTTLILWLLLVGCFLVRGYADNRDQAARLAAIVGVVATLDVPIIYRAAVLFGGMHPPDIKMDPRMVPPFLTCMLVFLLLCATMLLLRFQVACLEDRTDAGFERLSSLHQDV